MRQIAQTEQNEFMNEVEDSRIFIKGFVIGMPTNCLVLEYFVFLYNFFGEFIII